MNPYLRLSCLLIILPQVVDLQDEQEELDWSHVQAQFEALAANEEIQEGGEPISFDALVSGSSDVFEERISKARAYAQRLGTDNASSSKGHIFINGKYYVINDVRTPTTLFQRAPTHRQSSRTFWTRCNLVSDRHFSISKRRLLLFSRIVEHLTIYSC